MNGNDIYIYFQSQELVNNRNFETQFRKDSIRDCTLGCVSQLAIEIEQIKTCLKDYFLYLKKKTVEETPFIYQIVITMRKKQQHDQGYLDVTQEFLKCHLPVKAQVGGSHKKIKILGRVRNIHIVKNEHGKNIKMVK